MPDRFLNSKATGNNDGSSPANAWQTLSAAKSGLEFERPAGAISLSSAAIATASFNYTSGYQEDFDDQSYIVISGTDYDGTYLLTKLSTSSGTIPIDTTVGGSLVGSFVIYSIPGFILNVNGNSIFSESEGCSFKVCGSPVSDFIIQAAGDGNAPIIKDYLSHGVRIFGGYQSFIDLDINESASAGAGNGIDCDGYTAKLLQQAKVSFLSFKNVNVNTEAEQKLNNSVVLHGVSDVTMDSFVLGDAVNNGIVIGAPNSEDKTDPNGQFTDNIIIKNGTIRSTEQNDCLTLHSGSGSGAILRNLTLIDPAENAVDIQSLFDNSGASGAPEGYVGTEITSVKCIGVGNGANGAMSGSGAGAALSIKGKNTKLKDVQVKGDWHASGVTIHNSGCEIDHLVTSGCTQGVSSRAAGVQIESGIAADNTGHEGDFDLLIKNSVIGLGTKSRSAAIKVHGVPAGGTLPTSGVTVIDNQICASRDNPHSNAVVIRIEDDYDASRFLFQRNKYKLSNINSDNYAITNGSANSRQQWSDKELNSSLNGTGTSPTFNSNLACSDKKRKRRKTGIIANLLASSPSQIAYLPQPIIPEVPTLPLVPATITIDSITPDNIINSSEAVSSINITGTVGGPASQGDVVSVDVNGNNFTAAVLADKTYSVIVNGADLAAAETLDVSVSETGGGEAFNATRTANYAVKTTVTAIFSNIITNGNNIIDAATTGLVSITGQVTGDALPGHAVYTHINGIIIFTFLDANNNFDLQAASNNLYADDTYVITIAGEDSAGNEINQPIQHSHTNLPNPIVQTLTAPATSNSLTFSVTINALQGTSAIADYLIIESQDVPQIDNASAEWATASSTATFDFTASLEGNLTLWAYVRDSNGNINIATINQVVDVSLQQAGTARVTSISTEGGSNQFTAIFSRQVVDLGGTYAGLQLDIGSNLDVAHSYVSGGGQDSWSVVFQLDSGTFTQGESLFLSLDNEASTIQDYLDATQAIDSDISVAYIVPADSGGGTLPTLVGTVNPPQATVGVPYSYTFASAFSGDNITDYPQKTGAMGNGLTYDSSTATISGTPLLEVDLTNLSFCATDGTNDSSTSAAVTLSSVAASSGANWTILTDIENGQLGAKAQGDGKGFHDTANESYYSNTVVRPGRTKSIECNVRAGEPDFSNWGGAWHYSPLGKGDSIWFDLWVYYPVGFDFGSNSAEGMKFMRIHVEDGNGDNRGYHHNYIHKNNANEGGLFIGGEVRDSAGDTVFDTFSINTNGGWPLIDNALRGDALPDNQGWAGIKPVPTGVWKRFQQHVHFDERPGFGVRRTWVDGVPTFEDIQTGTLPNAASKSKKIYLWTYWNGGAPKDQKAYISDVTITRETPSTLDSNDNPFIA